MPGLSKRYELRVDADKSSSTSSPAISIAYGHDAAIASGIFLSVRDERLKRGDDSTATTTSNNNNNDELNKVAEAFGNSGVYLSLFTGDAATVAVDQAPPHSNAAIKVTTPTMIVFMRRYGVPDEHICECLRGGSEQLASQDIAPPNQEQQQQQQQQQQPKQPTKRVEQCAVCDAPTTKACINCRCVHYCSKACQVSGDCSINKTKQFEYQLIEQTKRTKRITEL